MQSDCSSERARGATFAPAGRVGGGGVQAGAVSQAVAATFDIHPTLLALAGADMNHMLTAVDKRAAVTALEDGAAAEKVWV